MSLLVMKDGKNKKIPKLSYVTEISHDQLIPLYCFEITLDFSQHSIHRQV
jgi:hypothetical protein